MKKIKKLMLVLLSVLLLNIHVTTFEIHGESEEGLDHEFVAEQGSHLVKFDFVELGHLDGGVLPDEVKKLLPENRYVKDDEKVDLPTFKDVAGYMFVGWEPGAFYEDGSELYFGVWQKLSLTKSIDRPDRPADKVITSGGTAVGIPGSGAPHQQLDYEDAFCYEPDVTGYANPTHSYWHVSTVNGKAAEIIGMGKMNNMPYGAIQAALWNYLKGGIVYTYGDYEVDPSADVYSTKGKYACEAAVYATYVTAAGAIQDLIMDGGCRITVQDGEAQVIKKAASTAIDFLAISPNNYSLANAEYGIYTDSACSKEVATLVTKEDGSSNIVTLNTGTYYIKEKKASNGFKLDDKVYTCVVSANNTTTITSIEDPIFETFNFKLYKENAYDKNIINNLDEAQFTIKYYDTLSDNVSSLKPKYSWVFKPIVNNGKVEVVFDQKHLVSGDKLNDGSLIMPIGTFTIEESKAPSGFAKDTNVYVGKVEDKNGTAAISLQSSGWIKVSGSQIVQSEQPQTVSISVQKMDKETNKAVAQGIATLKGAEFSVEKLNTQTNKREVVGKIISDDKGYGKLEKDNSGKKLLPGTYYVKETKAPAGYLLNDEEVTIEAKIKEANTANFDYQTTIKDEITQIKVFKVDSNGKQIASAEIELLDENDNVVYSFISDGSPHIIKGLKVGHHYKLHEKNVDSNFMLSNDIDVIVNDNTLKEYIMVDLIIDIHTNATFKENGLKNYVADGIAHIIDEVEYENLYKGKTYKLVGELIDKVDSQSLMSVDHTFIPTSKNGRTSMEFEFNLDDYDNHDFVVFETLYLIDEQGNENKVVEHKDLQDENQTVHIDELYRADLLIYKVDGDTKKALDDVEFEVSYVRTRVDGSIEEENLGNFITKDGIIEIEKLKKDSKVYLKEISAPENYYLNPEPYVIEIGSDEDVKIIEKTIENHEIKIHTSARFKESDSKNYVADGVAHIIDTVSYEWLYADKQYMLKAELIDKGSKDEPKQEVVQKSIKKFIPKDTNGYEEVEFSFNFDNYDEHDFVVFEELYEIKDGEEILIKQHKDIDDENQTVHVDKLYSAGMILYKVGNGNYNNKLNGAYYSVQSSRTKQDGNKVEQDLGIYLTGGIYLEDNKAFSASVYKDEELKDLVKTYDSKYDSNFKKQAVSIMDLNEGDYYVQMNDDEDVKKYVVQKGAIVLENQLQDSKLTYTEVKAPTSYQIDKNSYTFSVGHDYNKNIVENYRSNSLMYIPITGVE